MVKFIQGYFIFYDENMKYRPTKESPSLSNRIIPTHLLNSLPNNIQNDSNNPIPISNNNTALNNIKGYDSKDNVLVPLPQNSNSSNSIESLVENTTVQSSNLNEELGQIEYIFSDKTGTLTCNIMDFKKISIAGVSYGDYDGEKDENYIKNYENYPKVTNVDFRSRKILNELENEVSLQHQNIKYNYSYCCFNFKFFRECLFFLAICHTVVTEQKNDELIYNV